MEGEDLLIVEDIVDSGVTLNYLIHLLEQRKPRSIRIAALLDKPDRRQRPVKVSYVGFRIPDEFVVGYGLDYAERYRNLRGHLHFGQRRSRPQPLIPCGAPMLSRRVIS